MPKTESRESIVNVREGTAGATDPMSAEFVRQGLVAIQAVNRGLNRMQAELAYLVNSTNGRGPAYQGGFQAFGTAGAFPSAAYGFGTHVGYPVQPWGASAFTPWAIPGASYGQATAGPSIGPVSPGTIVGFNPQPDPPGRFTGHAAFNPQPDLPGRYAALNPQPLPPQPAANPWATFQGSQGIASNVPTQGVRVPIMPTPGFGTGFASNIQAFAPGAQAGFTTSPGFGAQAGFASPGSTLLGGPDTLPLGEAGLTPQLFRRAQDFQNAPPTGRIPPCDVVDEGSEYLVRLEIPGVSPESLEVTSYPNGLVVSARSRTEIPDGTLLLAESGPVAFRRAIELPAEVKTHETKATLQDGILTVHLAKQVPTEGPRQVDVAYR